MVMWHEVVQSAPEFAARVRALFDARKHKTMATIRRDGSPRISGMEMQFDDERITFGMMDGSMKALDVRRDPRVAFHSPSVDPPEGEQSGWVGEAKLSGRAVSRLDEEGGYEEGSYEIDIDEVALTYLGEGGLIIESWHPDVGHQRRIRT
jgi:hypothetical protein